MLSDEELAPAESALGAMTNWVKAPFQSDKPRGRLLVVVGTYSIGKERIVVGIAKALRTKIYVSSGKRRICACLEDQELMGMLTDDPKEGQVHMTSLGEIRTEVIVGAEKYLIVDFAVISRRSSTSFRTCRWLQTYWMDIHPSYLEVYRVSDCPYCHQPLENVIYTSAIETSERQHEHRHVFRCPIQ